MLDVSAATMFRNRKKWPDAICTMPTLILTPRQTPDAQALWRAASQRGWAVVEQNAAWGSGLYGCDPAAVLDVLRHAAET